MIDFLRSGVHRTGPSRGSTSVAGPTGILVEAATCPSGGLHVEIVGVDLAGMFDKPDRGLGSLQLVEASLSTWRPDRSFDLITCVHGLHYVGDKLDLITRAASWLVEGGVFAANLDSANLKVAGDKSDRRLIQDLRRAGTTTTARSDC